MRAKILFTFFVLFFIGLLTSSFIEKEQTNSKINEQQALNLNTDGLYFAEFYDYIFRGHFEEVKLKREDMDFLMIFEQYLRTYGKNCDAKLPKDKVKIMEQVCATEEVITNGYGIETSRTCVEWKWVWTGLYARPDLYQAKKEVEGLQSQNALGKALSMMTDPNAVGNSLDRVHKAKGLQNDMAQFFSLNDCASEGVRRFEENLKRYALDQTSIRIQGQSKYSKMKTEGGPTGSQNFRKLLDDLVANQARTWAFNRYVNGSISNVNVLSKDSQGRPREVKANYKYQGFGDSNAWVRVTFANGLPDCIYFFDFPQNCKKPNSGIVSRYAENGYAQN